MWLSDWSQSHARTRTRTLPRVTIHTAVPADSLTRLSSVYHKMMISDPPRASTSLGITTKLMTLQSSYWQAHFTKRLLKCILCH